MQKKRAHDKQKEFEIRFAEYISDWFVFFLVANNFDWRLVICGIWSGVFMHYCNLRLSTNILVHLFILDTLQCSDGDNQIKHWEKKTNRICIICFEMPAICHLIYVLFLRYLPFAWQISWDGENSINFLGFDAKASYLKFIVWQNWRHWFIFISNM